jgi:hypothetical protein
MNSTLAAKNVIRGSYRREFAAAALVFASIGTLAGCMAPPQPEGPTAMRMQVADYDAFIDRTLTMLREHDYAPRRVDRVSGVIAAGPTTGKQWFEFWRRDVLGPYHELESSLHTVRRIVHVEIDRADPASASDGGLCNVIVEVEKSRYSAPQRQVTTASGALAIYSERLPTREGLRNARERDEHWVPLGRDGELEQYLLDQISRFATTVIANDEFTPPPPPSAPSG